MRDTLDLDRYPLDRPGSPELKALVAKCRAELGEEGLFNLPGFVRPDALCDIVAEVAPKLANDAFAHERRHNIYFRKSIEGLSPDHPAMQTFQTSNRTICADQISQSVLIQLYEWPPLGEFLAAVIGKRALFTMADPLARVNVMGYGAGQTLNWHFDRSEFTTTLLLQAPISGGGFEYVKDLRRDDDPNYDRVVDLLEGRIQPTKMPVTAGTLNIFRGKNTAHRVAEVGGAHDRIISVFSYFERADVQFSDEERLGFYGRAS